MSSWDMGYNSSTLYLHLYHYVSNPLWIKFILTANGCRVPDLDHGYACELGIGQGVNINMHALTSTTEWYGNDFNPSQISFAKNLVPTKLENMHIYDDSFEQFSKRNDLPDFEYIIIHGIWSWISPENQQYLIDFINKHLKVGGMLFISYNTAPGHTAFEPTRHLMKMYIEQMLPHTLSAQEQIHDLFHFMQDLVDTVPNSFIYYPNFPLMINNFFHQDPRYLMSEYFSQAWDITHFGIIKEKLDAIKLKFVASAKGSNMIDIINFNQDQLDFIAPLAGTAIFEDLKDFMINNRFRTDIFVKGPTFLTPLEQEKAFQEFSAIRIQPIKNFKYQITRTCTDETIDMPREIYEPVLNFFGDYQVHSFGEVIAKLQGTKYKDHILTDQDVIDALMNLTALQALTPAYTVAQQNMEIIKRCQEYNRDFLTNHYDNPANYLVSPLTSSAIELHPLILTSLVNYLKNPNITANELKPILRQQVEDEFVKLANKEADRDTNDSDKVKETEATVPSLEERKQKQIEAAEQISEEFINHILPCYKALKLF